ncbi:flagellar hook protein FlgE [Rubellimicrobium sp. CFH 75288]|uniref:flagellar hook protein FlgE n=1 Tax=Rubellimicrobium sp. CFH 75288 TaxID=2697034 RepID=UPI00144C6772|nr:flagellar hook-basal body complex protein [Rubellimicrobium sp. CFH 75288]
MSISSSLNAGVAGLFAQASSLAAISDNIANAATPGYRRVTTDFAALVVGEGVGRYTAGGVRAADLRLVGARGPLSTSASATDLAVAGRGMLPVTRLEGGSAWSGGPFLMTPTGAFSPDADGYLRTPSGLVLLGAPVGPGGDAPGFSRTTAEGLAPVRIPTQAVAGSPTTRLAVSANLPAAATEAGASGTSEEMTVTYYDNLGKPQTLILTFEPVVPAAGAPPSNAWTLRIGDSASDGATIAEYRLGFAADRAGGGRLASVATLAGGAYDPATGQAVVQTAGGPLALSLGRPGEAEGFTQLAAPFSPAATERDGAPAASLRDVAVDAQGFVVARFDSGDTRRLFQVPVADVPNPEGLAARDGQAYAVTEKSGGFVLWNAGEGPTGAIQGFAREESAVDVAQELTSLIKTQRAYSSNAKVIQTVDEMLQETTNIKR